MRGSGVGARRHREPVRPRARAEDREARARLAAARGASEAPAARRDAARPRSPVATATPRSLEVLGQRPRDRGEVDDPGVGGMQRGDAAACGSISRSSLAVEAPQARHAVRAPAPLELVEPGSSVSSRATISLPQRSSGIPRSSQ